ncbi:MAG TPA: Hpt domain-containing protein, partial [Thermoanaerobaculia bacterium]
CAGPADGAAPTLAPQAAETPAAEPSGGSSLLDAGRFGSLWQLGESSGKPIVQTLVEIYLTETPRRLERMREALGREDAADLAFVAHSLKGISAQLGVVQVAEISGGIERMGRNGELGTAAESLAELERAFERAVPLLELERTAAIQPGR